MIESNLQCAEHCYLKKDIADLEEKMKKSAPLWSLVLLIGIMLSTASYSFIEISKVRAELHARITESNNRVVTSLSNISNTLSEVKARQELLLKHLNER